ncbi:MAG TPA: biopolymer transporter ExbD [Saprospiraceae bacterium]|nr:biopolymer transporter ExbD [Saprospiraceae bacterium]HRX28356.1 biopolymer transporter ExbD [Saprospiraceae bacterium]
MQFEKKRGKAQPAISTASLPDIIFMLLFFFMVVTVLRDTEEKVSYITPSASELTKLERKSLVNTILIGRPKDKYQKTYGSKPRIQLGDKFSDVTDIPLFLEEHRETVPEKQQGLIMTSLKVDGDVTMGIISDVKTALRKAGQLKVNYSAKVKERK